MKPFPRMSSTVLICESCCCSNTRSDLLISKGRARSLGVYGERKARSKQMLSVKWEKIVPSLGVLTQMHKRICSKPHMREKLSSRLFAPLAVRSSGRAGWKRWRPWKRRARRS